jgi:hypothetical protein
MVEKRTAHRVIGGRARRKETTRKTKTCVDNIKIDPIETRWDGMYWIDMAHNRDH